MSRGINYDCNIFIIKANGKSGQEQSKLHVNMPVRPTVATTNDGIHIGINYSVLNETKTVQIVT